MNYLDRALYAMQDFHGAWEAAELSVRSMAMLWNFHPYGFRYHDHWIRNLLIASSLNSRRALPKSSHTK